MKIYILMFICILTFCGCFCPKIEATKQWEGHYNDVDEFYKATENIKLNKNESIWVLSNSTLKRVLKNVKE